MGDLTENFNLSEFACKCCGESLGVDRDMVNKLQRIRDVYGKPMIVTSGIRCDKQNKEAGGTMDSEHLTGEGVDISCQYSADRYILVGLALQYFDRVGIGKDFIHMGVSASKPQGVLWDYY